MDCPELGYISIVEILSVGAELDLHFNVRTLGEVKAEREKRRGQVTLEAEHIMVPRE